MNVKFNELSFEKRDEFRRKAIAQNLVKILSSEVSISTIVLDGPWGSGKTEFCQKLLKMVEAEKVPLAFIYVDAFKYDHVDDPLAMLISAIASVVPDDGRKKDLLKKAIPVVKVLSKAIGRVALGIVLQTNADKIGEQVSEALADSSDDVMEQGIQKLLEGFEQAEEHLQIFKAALESLSAEKKIVVVIDELDRCRPDFSLSILEKIKHVFDVKNVRFVLSTNVRQLEAVVRKRYGSDLDAESYLSKFFSYTVHLPQDHLLNSDRYAQNSFRLLSDLLSTDPDLSHHFNEQSNVRRLFTGIFVTERRSLRDAEKFYRNLTILKALSPDYSIAKSTMWGYVVLRSLGIYLYTFCPVLCHRILYDKVSVEEFEFLLGVKVEELARGPNHRLNETILALIAFDIDEGLLVKTLGEEKAKEWSRDVYQVFQAGADPGRGNRLDVIRRVLRIMQMH